MSRSNRGQGLEQLQRWQAQRASAARAGLKFHMTEEGRAGIAISKRGPGTLPAAFWPFQEWERMFDGLVEHGWMRRFRWEWSFGLPTLRSPPLPVDGTLKVGQTRRTCVKIN